MEQVIWKTYLGLAARKIIRDLDQPLDTILKIEQIFIESFKHIYEKFSEGNQDRLRVTDRKFVHHEYPIAGDLQYYLFKGEQTQFHSLPIRHHLRYLCQKSVSLLEGFSDNKNVRYKKKLKKNGKQKQIQKRLPKQKKKKKSTADHKKLVRRTKANEKKGKKKQKE